MSNRIYPPPRGNPVRPGQVGQAHGRRPRLSRSVSFLLLQRTPRRSCSAYPARSSHRTRKGQSSSQLPRRVVLKNVLTIGPIAFISHVSKVMFKILHAMLQHYVNQECPDVQGEFRKGRRTRDQIANIRWIIEKAREF